MQHITNIAQEQILSADVCNKWTLSFLNRNNETKYASIMVTNTHSKCSLHVKKYSMRYLVYVACAFLVNTLIMMIVLLVTPMKLMRGLLCLSIAACFLPILTAAWFLRGQTNRCIPIILCSLVAVLLSLGASSR